MNFAVRILREICPAQELVGKNIRGARGRQAVDPSKVEQIRELIKKHYPAPPSESERNWRECRKAIDSFKKQIKLEMFCKTVCEQNLKFMICNL